MAALIVLLLLLLPAVADAAPPCYPLGIKGEARFEADWFKRTDNGWYAFWLCKGAKWEAHGIYCRHGSCVQQEWLAAQLAIGQSADKAAAADAAYAASVKQAQCSTEIAGNTPNAPICRELVAAMDAAAAAANPAPEVWQVAKAAANANPPGTLPVYRWNGTTLGGAISGVRATSGATCDCGTRSGAYCLVPSLGRLDAMARCEKL